MQKRPSISLFFPAYNEEGNIVDAIREADRELSRITDEYEIIVVNDGSRDRTRPIAEMYAAGNSRARVVSHATNLGYGAALRTGIAEARMDYVFFTDADLQFRISDLHRLFHFVPNYKAVIGYRAQRSDPPIRLFYAWGWRMLNRILFGLKFRDLDCAFKLFERKTIQSLNLQSRGAMISAEILLKLSRKNVAIQEIPVPHFPRTAGNPTGAKFAVIIRALAEMAAVWKTEFRNSIASLERSLAERAWIRRIIWP